MYNFLLKYFYSWYSLPIILLHELTHYIVAKLFNYKILKFNLYLDKNIKIFNSNLIFEYKYDKKSIKYISYSPLLLFLLFFNIYTTIYLISTIIYYNGQFIILFLPSKSDKDYINKLDYFKYIVDIVGEVDFNNHIKSNNINELIKKHHLLSFKEFNTENS